MTTNSLGWTPIEWDPETGLPIKLTTKLGGAELSVSTPSLGASCCWTFWAKSISHGASLPFATTAEEAIAEAVVTIAQHLARLNAELFAIPVNLPQP